MAVAARIGAEEAAIELGGAELLVGLEVAVGRENTVGWREDEGGEGASAGDLVAFVFGDVVVVRLLEGFGVPDFGEMGDADDIYFLVFQGPLVLIVGPGEVVLDVEADYIG